MKQKCCSMLFELLSQMVVLVLRYFFLIYALSIRLVSCDDSCMNAMRSTRRNDDSVSIVQNNQRYETEVKALAPIPWNCEQSSSQYSLTIPHSRIYKRGDAFCLQDDRRFGLDNNGYLTYYVGSTLVWSPINSTGEGSWWIFQANGNLVVYNASRAVWSSHWDGSYRKTSSSQLIMSTAGLAIQKNGDALWGVLLGSEFLASGNLFYLAYYYSWYLEGDWSRHEVQDVPLLGYYGTDSPTIAEQHIEWALRARVSSWVVSWWGNDRLSKRHFDQGMLRARNIGQIKFCILYESMILKDYSFLDGSAQNKLRNDLLAIQSDYFSHPSYLRLNGRPVVILYITRSVFGEGFDRGVLEMLRNALNDDIYFIADEPFFGNGNDYPATSANGLHPLDGTPIFEAYTTYNMFQNVRVRPGETASDYMLREAMPIFHRWANETLFFPNVLPMYHDFRGKEPLVGNPEDFLRQLQAVSCLPKPTNNSIPNLVFVTSFNEWWEGSQIEPDSQNRYAFNFIDALARFKDTVDLNGYFWCQDSAPP